MGGLSHIALGFGADDGASLLMAFRGLQAESAKQGDVHNSIANELRTLVAEPFEVWARGFQASRTYASFTTRRAKNSYLVTAG
jgi:hypothetical protein